MTRVEPRRLVDRLAPDVSSRSDPPGPSEALVMAQGAYYAATGPWALVDVDSFQAVTGPKADVWLVKAVGALVTVVGGALGLAGLRRRVTPEMEVLAVGSALGLAAIDTDYVARGRIAPIYLADAAAELRMAAAWGLARRRRRGGASSW